MELLPRAFDSAFWREVREKECFRSIREEIFALWEKNCTQPITALTYSEFRMFKYTGNRSVYENNYCTRRRGLCASGLLALIYPEEEKYIERLMDTVYAICDEYTWCLPAHNTALEVNNNCHLDLFACETAEYLSEICVVFGDRLEPLIHDRVRAELERRVYTPFAEKIFGWEKIRTNWNAVCTGLVACSMMLMRPDLAESYLPRFTANMELYLDGFEDDGVCEEGVSYWHYGFGHFLIYADFIRRFTASKPDPADRIDYFTRPKVKAIATFMQKMYISGEVTVSFSDAGMRNEYHLGIFHFLKNEYPDDVTVPDPKHSYITDGRGRWGILFRVFMWFNEDYLTPDSRAEEETFYAADTGWLIYRNPKFGFAAKGGYNNEPHNHNDVGSFIIATDNRQVITDMGAGRYTRQYFARDTRYGILQCSSRGHSVPIVGGEYQKFGSEYRAENVKCEDGIFSLEMASAYGLPELKSLKREFEWSKDTVILRDLYVYDGEGALVERFVTLYPPKEISRGRVDMHGAVLVYDPDRYELSFSSEVRNAEGRVAYFTDLTLKDGVREFVCEFCV